VTISQDFYLGKYEVTQEQWQAVMGHNPSHSDGCNRCPVEQVSWNDAINFCETVSGVTGYNIRLPSEAQWEYACRAGTTTEYHFGDDPGDLGDYAWHQANSGDMTHNVGEKLPNVWGLYDMHGNVWEWCNDWHRNNYYSESPSLDPIGPASSGSSHVFRGGSWYYIDAWLRSATRHRAPDPGYSFYHLGFRVAADTQ